jgi:hypothetical protein
MNMTLIFYTEMHTAEPLMPEPISLDAEIKKLSVCIYLYIGVIKFRQN